MVSTRKEKDTSLRSVFVVIDKNVYVLMGLLLLSSLLLSGCVHREQSENPEVIDVIEWSPSEDDATTAPSSSTTSDEETSSDGTSTEEAPTEEATASNETVAPEETSTPSEPEETFLYVDGSYTQTGSYQNPAGGDSITVTLTVDDDVVTALTVLGNATNPTTKNYQSLFISGIPSLVVGKSLDSLGSLGPVNGSSLTPNGFNQALAAIKASATHGA